MNDTLTSLVRPLGPRDHLRFAELARISACLETLSLQGEPGLANLLEALGDLAGHVTISRPTDDGTFAYCHFGAAIAREAGFSMDGRSTADFDPETRSHIETSFRQVLQSGIALCTIMPGAVSGVVHSWQRVVYPVRLQGGLHLVAVVRPLHRALDAIHGRQADVAVCVLPLKRVDGQPGFALSTEAPLERYLRGADITRLRGFVSAFHPPDSTPAVGTLMATFADRLPPLDGPGGQPADVIADIVHGFTAPFLVVVNATASSRTNEQLRSATHVLKASFDVGRLGSWSKRSPSEDALYVAPELAAIYGITPSPEGIISLRTIRANYLGNLAVDVQQAVDTCWQTGEDYCIEGRYRRPCGTVIDIRISGRPMRDQSGKVVSLFGIVQDITEQKEAQRELEDSEGRFRDFANSAGDWCWETDAEHRITIFADNPVRSDSVESPVLNGRTPAELPVVPEDREMMARHFEDLAAHRPFSDFISRLDCGEAGVQTLQVSGKPRFAADGTFLGYRGTGRNISARVAAEQEHQERLLALRSAQSIAGFGHWVTDLSTNRTRWSHGILQLFGFREGDATDPDRLLDAPDFNLRWLMRRVHGDDRARIRSALRETVSSQGSALIDVRYTARGRDDTRHMRVQLRFEPASKLAPARLIGVAQDVTDLKSVQAELEKRTKALDQAQMMGGIGDWQHDLASGVITWSPQMFAILRLDPEAFVPSPETVATLCPPDDSAAVMLEHARVLREGVDSTIDVQARRGDGTMGYYSMVTKPTLDSKGAIVGMFGTVQDITERKRAEAQLKSLAYFDPLTGLANRTLFSRELNDVMKTVIRSGGSAALLLLDLDHFKEVNDTLGHAAGDELLSQVARTLRENINHKGFVARLGGDEFAIIIRNYSSVACLTRFAETVVSRLSGVLRLKRGEVITGTSMGIALIPQDGGTAEEVLRNADLALYMAKDDGRGRALFFEPDMSRSVQARLRLARDLRAAVENGDLESRFQGQVDLATGKVVGFETLLRWKHPSRGYVPPSEFIPVAESSSLIGDIGLWVMRDACRTGRAWLDAGEVPRMISVNVSAAQIWQSNFEDDVIAIIEETGYPPEYLCIELTENVFADHSEGRVRAALARFKAAGIHLALDDFGTGYSSLGYLNELPFDELKIDRCFITDVHKLPDKARLLEGIIALGKGLGMRTVAEGAETEGEVEALRAMGCDLVQGYVFMRPESAVDALRSADQLEFRLSERPARGMRIARAG